MYIVRFVLALVILVVVLNAFAPELGHALEKLLMTLVVMAQEALDSIGQGETLNAL